MNGRTFRVLTFPNRHRPTWLNVAVIPVAANGEECDSLFSETFPDATEARQVAADYRRVLRAIGALATEGSN